MDLHTPLNQSYQNKQPTSLHQYSNYFTVVSRDQFHLANYGLLVPVQNAQFQLPQPIINTGWQYQGTDSSLNQNHVQIQPIHQSINTQSISLANIEKVNDGEEMFFFGQWRPDDLTPIKIDLPKEIDQDLLMDEFRTLNAPVQYDPYSAKHQNENQDQFDDQEIQVDQQQQMQSNPEEIKHEDEGTEKIDRSQILFMTAQEAIDKFHVKFDPIVKLDSQVNIYWGEKYDLSFLELRKCIIPNTKNYVIISAMNPVTRRQLSFMVCQYQDCYSTFRKWINFFDHLRIHTHERPYICEIQDCRATFNQLANLKNHKIKHQGVKPFLCDQCPRSFTTKFNRKVHQQIHKRNKDKLKAKKITTDF